MVSNECAAPNYLSTPTPHLNFAPNATEHVKTVMLIRTTDTLHYPITVTKLLRDPGDSIRVYDVLFKYTYTSTVTEGDKYGDTAEIEKTFPAEFRSEAVGKLLSCHIKPGDVLSRPG